MAILLIFFFHFVAASKENDPYQTGLQHIYNYEFDQANCLFDQLIADSPDDPKPYFFKALVYWWRYTGNIYDQKTKLACLQHIQKAVTVGENTTKSEKNTANNSLFLGLSYGYMSAYHISQENFLKGMYYASKSKNILQVLLRQSPNMYDAHFGIGLFAYYKLKLPSLLGSVSEFFGDEETSSAIEFLEITASRGRYMTIEALVALGNIYLYDKQDYWQASNIYQVLSAKYPKNPYILTQWSLAYQKQGEFEKAIAILTSLLDNDYCVYVSENQKAEIYATLARIYREKENYALEYQAYQKAARIANVEYMHNAPWINFHLGSYQELTGNYEVALDYYEKVLNCVNRYNYHTFARESIQRIKSNHHIK